MDKLQFTLANTIEILPDFRRRILESEARKWADANYSPRRLWYSKDMTLQQYMVREHEKLLWLNTYSKRKERIKRIKEKHG